MQDELMLLWQQGASSEPDPAEVARLAGKAAVTKFDRRVFWRNSLEYAAGAVLVGYNIYQLATEGWRTKPLLTIAAVLFVLGYLWRKHRNVVIPDPSADARTYHAALLHRIDQQIRLLSNVRYWYVLPLYLTMVWQFVQDFSERPLSVLGSWAVVTLLCWGVITLNEQWTVDFLKRTRTQVQALYSEES